MSLIIKNNDIAILKKKLIINCIITIIIESKLKIVPSPPLKTELYHVVVDNKLINI